MMLSFGPLAKQVLLLLKQLGPPYDKQNHMFLGSAGYGPPPSLPNTALQLGLLD
ncbi:hypothetical protein QJS10_CPB12g01317 [Acorus calamus]|uniref:Uncharacterized protein n=1 Tax=Acorus calamus TaxID=4465 RepID=A0AAV9DNY1_ACOCL|nr:hypothetical protein QJS10_CPB12g01317 [Acorus calamus]